MKRILIFGVIVLTSCTSRHKKFEKMADIIKQRFMASMPDIYKIDTLFLTVDTITPKKVLEINAAELELALIDMRITGKIPQLVDGYYPRDTIPFLNYITDTLYIAEQLQYEYERYLKKSRNADSTTFLYFHANPFIYYNTKNMDRHYAQDEVLFDKSFNIVSPETVILKFKNDYSYNLEEQPYLPISDSVRAAFPENGILIYY
jgi:hypothetical protein